MLSKEAHFFKKKDLNRLLLRTRHNMIQITVYIFYIDFIFILLFSRLFLVVVSWIVLLIVDKHASQCLFLP